MPGRGFLEDIYIIDGRRSPIGRAFRSLKDFSAPQLAASVIQQILPLNNIPSSLIGQVIVGNTVSAGIGQNMARLSAVYGGLPSQVPAFTVNNVCGSGLQAIIIGAWSLCLGEGEVIVVGGSESASQAPFLTYKMKKDEEKIDSLIHDGLWCHITNKHMGELADLTAKKNNISRKQQDEYAFSSYTKAKEAKEKGFFDREILPVNGLSFDERLKKEITKEKLASFSPAFGKEGTITAGNSPAPADGSAMLILASQKAVKKYNLKPKARLIITAATAGPPEDVFMAAVPSIQEALKRANKTINDIDLFEITEAFSVQAIYTQQTLAIPYEKMNVFGGDVALGHPLGAAGARTMVTLLYALETLKKRLGLVSVCLGGGGAVSVIIEKIET